MLTSWSSKSWFYLLAGLTILCASLAWGDPKPPSEPAEPVIVVCVVDGEHPEKGGQCITLEAFMERFGAAVCLPSDGKSPLKI